MRRPVRILATRGPMTFASAWLAGWRWHVR